MLVGVSGSLLTDNVLAPDVPQPLEAVTDRLPPVKMLLLIIGAMLLLVEVPLKPVGNVQLYWVAPVEEAQV